MPAYASTNASTFKRPANVAAADSGGSAGAGDALGASIAGPDPNTAEQRGSDEHDERHREPHARAPSRAGHALGRAFIERVEIFQRGKRGVERDGRRGDGGRHDERRRVETAFL